MCNSNMYLFPCGYCKKGCRLIYSGVPEEEVSTQVENTKLSVPFGVRTSNSIKSKCAESSVCDMKRLTAKCGILDWLW